MLTKVTNNEQIAITAALAHKIWNQHYVPIIGKDQVDYMLETIQSERAIANHIKEGYEYYLLFDNEIPTGYLALRSNHPRDKMMISKIYIIANEQGKGYGHQLLQFIKNLCLQRSLKSAWLTVNRHNTESMKWYRKRGFEIVEEKQFDIGNGFIMDDYVLEAPIKKLLPK